MPNFDTDNPIWAELPYAKKQIQDAWLAQFANAGYISRLIRYGTQGPHSHSALLRRNNGTVDVLEVREWYGGRAVPIERCCYNGSGRIDVFKPCKDNMYADRFDANNAVEMMRVLTAADYGWRGCIGMGLRRTPLLWRLYKLETSDVLEIDGKPKGQPFCSHAVALACEVGGGIDVVPRCPNYLVTPNHLTFSMFFDYQFSILTPWCERKYKVDRSAVLRLPVPPAV